MTRLLGAREEGIKEGIYLSAKRMIDAGIELSIVHQVTGLAIGRKTSKLDF